MARDNQRQKVYDWERKYLEDLPGNKSLSLEECQQLINRSCQRYSKVVPELKDGRGTRFARGSSRVINLPGWARKTWVVLHEIAHSIQMGKRDLFTPFEYQYHGPEFMRLFLDLLVWQKLEKLPELRRSAKKSGIKVATAIGAPRPSGWQNKLKDDIDRIVEKYQKNYNLSGSRVKTKIKNIV